MDNQSPDQSQPVTVETDDGRIFSGVGVTEDSLHETIEARHEPDSSTQPADKADVSGQTDTDRNTDGTFKTSRGSRRFAAITAEKLKIDEARQAAEQRATELEARLAALEKGRTEPEPKAAKAETSAPAEFDEPEPTLEEFSEAADPYAAWNRALARWDRKKEAFEAKQAGADLDAKINSRFQEVHEHGVFVQQLNKLVTDGQTKYSNWLEVMQGPAKDIVFPDATYRAIVNSPNAVDMVYTLAQDPELARKVAAERDPLALGMLLGSLRPAQGTVARPASTAPALASSAPRPYQPVGSGSKTTSPSLGDMAAHGDDYDSSGYRERRAAERKGTRR